VAALRLRLALMVLECTLATCLGATATRRTELIRAIHEEIEDLEACSGLSRARVA
jgi:hypothetical protein